jgi:beta-glucoside operon transcriptional antiterminator
MRAVKVLNNSLVLALDEDGKEAILMGKGIGYQKAIGYQFHENEIEKVFVLKDRDVSKNIIRLAAETDSVYFELAKQVIDYAKEEFGMELMDHIYLSLTDHLAFAVRRVRDGIILKNFYTMDMKKFNPDEFDVGEYAVNLVNKSLGVEIPPDEAGNIAFHFINAQYDHPYNMENQKIASVVDAVLDIVKYHFGITYREDSTAYDRYVTHVRLFAQRLVSHTLLPNDKSDILYKQIEPVCKKEFECVRKIQIYITDQFHTNISNQEEMYLALHVHRVLEEN